MLAVAGSEVITLVAVPVAAGTVLAFGRFVGHWLRRAIANDVRSAVRDVVEEVVKEHTGRIRDAVERNGGSSMRDGVDRIESDLRLIAARLTVLEADVRSLKEAPGGEPDGQ